MTWGMTGMRERWVSGSKRIELTRDESLFLFAFVLLCLSIIFLQVGVCGTLPLGQIDPKIFTSDIRVLNDLLRQMKPDHRGSGKAPAWHSVTLLHHHHRASAPDHTCRSTTTSNGCQRWTPTCRWTPMCRWTPRSLNALGLAPRYSSELGVKTGG